MSALLFGKLAALVASNTEARLARLDAAITTRTSNVVWTDTKAGYLDGPVSAAGGKHRVVKLTSGTSWVHPSNIKDSLVYITMAGGGGAGKRVTGSAGGGGGGGGQVLVRVPYILGGSPTAYAIGAGGVGAGADTNGTNGEDTTFGTLTALGGKFAPSSTGGDGGATAKVGGGAEYGIGGSSSNGLNGKAGYSSSFQTGGGGGGVGHATTAAAGGPSALGVGGANGGLCGGGGGSWGNGAAGANADGGNAAANTGGGGGGANSGGTGGDGGSGVIIIEYEEAT